MMHIEKSITVDAPSEQVFEFLSEPSAQLRINENLEDIENFETLPDGTMKMDWIFSKAGKRFECTSESYELVPGEKMFFKVQGCVNGEIRWSFDEIGGGRTKVIYAADYELPSTLLSLAKPLIKRAIAGEVDATLENLKREVESRRRDRGAAE